MNRELAAGKATPRPHPHPRGLPLREQLVVSQLFAGA
jgi:hypothetical protein